MSETLTRADLLKHESDWKDRLNKAKEEIYNTIQVDRHDSKNRDHVLWIEVSENRENIALHQQSQKFMEEKVSKIEEHLTEGIAEIKQIIKEQAETFATKAEHRENQIKINWVIKIMWTFWVAGIIALATFAWQSITK